MREVADGQMKAPQQHYNPDHDKNICSWPQTLNARQYVYIDHPSMTTDAAEGMITGSNRKLMSPKIGTFRIVESPASTVTVDENAISNIV